jgi:hypothetical protein
MNKYHKKAGKIAGLVTRKQLAYGNSFNRACEIMRILYPAGIRPDQYRDSLSVIRVIDKLFRISHKKDAFGEDPWQDIAGYALLSISENKTKNGG